ncbi:MAG: hypothetical protein IKK70_01105 [Clostridia bacterium]|nr:hypothetical protein [Clostridia bacterium]
MPFYYYIGIVYLVIINIVTLVMYVAEAEHPSSRLSATGLILLPIIGGSLGACIANFFSDTEYRERRSWLSKFLAFIPPFMFIVQFLLIVTTIGVDNVFSFVWNHAVDRAGWIGEYLIVINIIAFVLVIIRKSAYYIAPHGNFLIPDIILIPILIIGGATGGAIAKILFNFKEDWSCNSTMEFQNFIYNAGMFVVSVIHIGLYAYFFYIR